MRYYRYLYLPDGLEKKKNKIIHKLEKRKIQPSVHLILLPVCEKHQLEIINSAYLIQPDYPQEDWLVVGIAKGYDSALELIETISNEVYLHTGNLKIREYILKKEQDG